MRTAILVFSAALAVLNAPLPAERQQPVEPGDWRAFEGTWTASGQRQTLAAGEGRTAGTVQLSGALVLASGEGLGRGFRSEAIAYDDGSGVVIGRCVWTDERGDRVFSELKATSIVTGRQVTGTITGGTGRYLGLAGEFSFDWQYVVAAEGAVHGRAVRLRGRVRTKATGR